MPGAGDTPQPTIEDAFEQLPIEAIDMIASGMSVEQVLASLHSDEPPPGPGPNPPQPIVAPDLEPEPEEAEQEGDGEEPEPDAAPPAEARKTPGRIRLNHLQEGEKELIAKANDAVKNGTFPSFAAAWAALNPPATPAQPPAAPAGTDAPLAKVEPAPPEVPPALAALDAEIAATRAALKAAMTEDYDPEAQFEATVRLTELNAQRSRELDRAEQAQAQATAQAARQQDYDRTYEATLEELETAHPALLDEASPLFQIVEGEGLRLQARAQAGDQAARRQLEDPTHLRGIVARFAPLFNGSRPAPAPYTPTPQKPARPVGSLSTPNSPVNLDSAAAIKILQDNSLVDLDTGDTSLLDRAIEMAASGRR